MDEKSGVGHQIINVETDIKSKRSFLGINNRDNMCLAWAIAFGIASAKCNAASGAAKAEPKKVYNQMKIGEQKNRYISLKERTASELAGVPTDRFCT